MQGPTSRFHYESDDEDMCDFVPSSDKEMSPADLGDSDDDDGDVKNFELASGMKRKLKKMKKRLLNDPKRVDPHESFCLKLCFRDVSEFRVALRNFHIAQLRILHITRMIVQGSLPIALMKE